MLRQNKLASGSSTHSTGQQLSPARRNDGQRAGKGAGKAPDERSGGGVLKLAKEPEERKAFKTFCIRSLNPETMKWCWAGQWVRAELSLQDEEGHLRRCDLQLLCKQPGAKLTERRLECRFGCIRSSFINSQLSVADCWRQGDWAEIRILVNVDLVWCPFE